MWKAAIHTGLIVAGLIMVFFFMKYLPEILMMFKKKKRTKYPRADWDENSYH